MTQKRKNENDVVVSAGTAAAARRKAVTPRAKHSKSAEAPVSAPVANASASVAATHEEIARLAYSYWEARGCQGGSPEEDWLRAEMAIRNANLAPVTTVPPTA